MKSSLPMALLAISIAAMLSGCSHEPPPEPLRAVRTVEIRYDKTQETDRYFGSVQARYEVDQGFRVGGKVMSRKVDVGQKVRQGDVIAVLDDSDYKLAHEAVEVANRNYQSASVNASSKSQDIEQLAPAAVPARPVRPRLFLNTLLGTLMGFVLLSTAATARESYRDLNRNAWEELEEGRPLGVRS